MLGCLTTNVSDGLYMSGICCIRKIKGDCKTISRQACLTAASVSLALNAALDCATRLANTQSVHSSLRVWLHSYDVSSSLVVTYRIHSEVRAVFAGRRSILAHRLGG